ncbi:MAG: hypothetical protein VKL59_04225 [Nostocaceae cyanobacterium]|nr:hypothetical protein [Nostocaceae cyanobacterium]
MPDNQSQDQIEFPRLPLAVYRELAAHLRSTPGVEASLITQTSQQFDYHQSQIAGLQIEYSTTANSQSRERVQQILAYYKQRYNN